MPGTRSRIMYLESKGEGWDLEDEASGLSHIAGDGRIGRVTFSKSGRTLRYRRWEFAPDKGYKHNHIDVETGQEFWISGPRKDGQDALYPGTVHVDEDVREEYWSKIRGLPDKVHLTSYRSLGKYRR